MTTPDPRKVLIANRGEIAVRIARACADHGYTSVAVYADGDADALHVRLADEAHGLSGVTAAETYLDADKILAAARASGASLVHPGYGFLSESADFARAVRDAGLRWVGPSPESIELLGDKISARRIAESVGAPLIAGTTDPVEDASEAVAFAEEHGLPIAIKAAFGGGGRGMRVARRLDEVAELFEAAGREAVAAFGRGECFVERYLERPRHVEAQVLADDHGNVVVLGTRDCSLQRRSQKLVEEAPAPFLTDDQRERIHAAARDICAAADYRGAATVEFLLGADGLLSFLEVNTRVQVEHPVTEETTGVDIVGEQLRIADGLPLSVTETPVPRGHAIEFRINAEDPARGFLPVPGTIGLFSPPTGPGVRLDTGVETGSEVSGRFDSLMAKLIVTGVDRDAALARARRALAEFRIEGVASVLPFHRAVLDDADFTARDGFAVHTQWIETTFADRTPPQGLAAEPADPDVVSSWIEVDGRRLALRLPAALAGVVPAATGRGAPADERTDGWPTPEPGARGGDGGSGGGGDDGTLDGAVVAPMHGTLVRWAVEDGATVEAGDTIAVIEAMKMESTVIAPRAGSIERVASLGPGDPVSPDAPLAHILPA